MVDLGIISKLPLSSVCVYMVSTAKRVPTKVHTNPDKPKTKTLNPNRVSYLGSDSDPPQVSCIAA